MPSNVTKRGALIVVSLIAELLVLPALGQELQKAGLYVETGHTGMITNVVFSPDGKTIATGDNDATVKLWDAETGQELWTFKNAKEIDMIDGLVFSPDGRMLAAASAYTIILWELASKRAVRTFKARKTDFAFSAVFSPDGRLIASGGLGTTLRLWDVASGEELALTGDTSQTSAVVFSADGEMIVSGSWDTTVKLWSVASRKQVRTLEGHAGAVLAVAISPSGKSIASVSRDQTIRLWDSSSGNELYVFKLSYLEPSVAFSPDGKTITSGPGVWDVGSGREVRGLGGPNDTGRVAFSPDGKMHATLNKGQISLWDEASREELRAWEVPPNSAVIFSPNGGTIAWWTFGTVTLQDAVSGRHTRTLNPDAHPVQLLAFSPDGKKLAAGSEYASAVLWDLVSGKKLFTLKAEVSQFTQAPLRRASRNMVGVKPFTSLRFSPDGMTLASGTFSRDITLWDTDSGKLVRVLTGATSDITSIAFSPDGSMIAAGSLDNTLRLWNSTSGKQVQALNTEPARSIVFSRDGKKIASVGSNGVVRIWLALSGRQLRAFNGPAGDDALVAISPDGETIVSGYYQLKASRASSGEELYTLPGNTEGTTCLCFSEDGRIIASKSPDSGFNFWDARSGQFLRRLSLDDPMTPNQVFATVPECYRTSKYEPISLDGRLQIMPGESGRVNVFAVQSGRLLASLVALGQEDWTVTTPEGRFDTSRPLDDIEGLHWIVNNQIFAPLSLDIFMRQYYEPGLLRRVVNGEQFKPLPSIADINRVQPKISVEEIKIDSSRSDLVNVTVTVKDTTEDVNISATDPTKREQFVSGVYDLRLFRDGQLVGYSTSDERVQSTFRTYKGFDDELANWREANRVDLVYGKKTFTFTVKIPVNSSAKVIEFSAYAFNEDRVKSETARLRWSPPETANLTSSQPKLKPRAYVISVGVNANENPAFDLQFAANDARRFQEVLPQRLTATGEYSEVVPVSLISDWELRRGQKVTTKRDATKANFKAVLDLLAGRPVADEIKRAIPNAEKLAKTTPDDMVLILFSSHGYADQSGNFYFIPYDTGPGACSVFTETVRQRSISSDELSLWLRDVDAGQMTLIVDACYSTAAIEGSGFKPGPMGSRGLGQLAYDKRMRILTATQADNVAIELPATAKGQPINHGLLSYALLEDGLGANKADFKPQDKTIFMDEWLEYAVADVPKLFANQPRPINETQTTSRQRNDRPRLVLLQRQLADPGACGPAASGGPVRTQEQQPSLFDFTRRKREVALVRNP